MSRRQRIDISALNERCYRGDFLFVTCPSQFEAGDILTKACTDAKVWGRNLMSIGHFRRVLYSHFLEYVVCRSRVDRLPLYLSLFVQLLTCRGGGVFRLTTLIRLEQLSNASISDPMECSKFSNFRNINLCLDDNAKGIGISNVRVPPSGSICVVSVPTSNSSIQRVAGCKQKGWKETSSDLKEREWEAKRLLGTASRAISCEIPNNHRRPSRREPDVGQGLREEMV